MATLDLSAVDELEPRLSVDFAKLKQDLFKLVVDRLNPARLLVDLASESAELPMSAVDHRFRLQDDLLRCDAFRSSSR